MSRTLSVFLLACAVLWSGAGGAALAQVPGAPGSPTELTAQSFPQLLQQAGYQVNTTVGGLNMPLWKFNHPQTGYQITISPEKVQGNKVVGFSVMHELSPVPAA